MILHDFRPISKIFVTERRAGGIVTLLLPVKALQQNLQALQDIIEASKFCFTVQVEVVVLR